MKFSKQPMASAVSLGSLIAVQSVRFGSNIAEISQQWNDVFPANNFNRNVSTPFWETTILDDTTTNETRETLRRIEEMSFIVYDNRMYDLLGVSGYTSSKELEVIFEFPKRPSYAQRQVHDATVYVPSVKAVFFAELHSPKPDFGMTAIPFVWRIDVSNTSTPEFEKVNPEPALTIANGAYHHNGSVYWAQEGNFTTPGGIVQMDPTTMKTQIVKNNFYSHRFNSPNDVVVSDEGVAYFTDGYYGYDNFNDTLKPQLANGVYRWDMKTGNTKMVAGAADGAFFNPNGVAFDAYQNKLFVTNRGNSSADPAGGRTIYQYDLTPTGITNREIFAYVDSGFPDGIKTDRDGRVYAGVTGGVDVFEQDGTLIGRIKVNNGDVAVNMAWVNDWLYIVGRDYAYRVQLEATER